MRPPGNLSLIHIFLKQLGTFVDQGYVHLLRLQERELFADSLAAYARKYGLIPSGVGIEMTVSPSAWMWDLSLIHISTGRRSEVTGRPIRSLLIPFKDSPLRRRCV